MRRKKHFSFEPFFITNYPSYIKYFNMKRAGPDFEFVNSVDLIAPPFGEISGGAEREEDPEKLKSNLLNSQMYKDIKKSGLRVEDFDWYLDIWRNEKPVPRGGFGLGMERVIGFITGLDDIRLCTEFVRNAEVLFP